MNVFFILFLENHLFYALFFNLRAINSVSTRANLPINFEFAVSRLSLEIK